MKNQKLLKVANVRERMDAHYRGEISYSRAVELLNEDANKALAIGGVMPRFPDNQLHFKRGSRAFNLRGSNIAKKPTVAISCIEHWEVDDPDFGDPEHDHATFYPTTEEIDEIIQALHEAKAFLNGA